MEFRSKCSLDPSRSEVEAAPSGEGTGEVEQGRVMRRAVSMTKGLEPRVRRMKGEGAWRRVRGWEGSQVRLVSMEMGGEVGVDGKWRCTSDRTVLRVDGAGGVRCARRIILKDGTKCGPNV